MGLPRLYVPAEFGGALTRYDELVAALQAVARRDLTVAIGHGKTFLGASACGWRVVRSRPVSWAPTSSPGHRCHGD